MLSIRYVGPHRDGVDLPSGDHAPHGEPVDVADDLVHGTPHVFVDGYEPPENPDDVDSDQIVVHGTAGLLAQTYVDADGTVKPCFELARAKAAPKGKPDGDTPSGD